MGRLARLLRIAGVAACLSGVTDAAVAQNLSGKLNPVIQAQVPKGFSGVVLVARGNKVLLEHGYGSIRGATVRADSKFWIASAGKQFVSAAILKCQERGQLSLGDPLARFFPTAPADKRGITVRQLLSHTSGLGQQYVADEVPSRAEAVTRVLPLPLIDKPGAKFHYSNNNYELAAAVVEIASGDDYQHFVLTNLLRPAGLNDTGFAGMAGAKSVLPARDETPPRLSRRSWGEAAVYSTASDLARWFWALHDGKVLKRESAALLFKAVAPIQEGQTALGWFLGRSPQGAEDIFTRGNEDFGPNSLIYFYPRNDILVVVLTHAGMMNDDLSWSRAILQRLEPLVLDTSAKE